MIKPFLRRVIKFGVSGVIVTACHTAYAVTAIQLNGWTPPAANGAAFTFGTLISYLLNTRWSFSGQISGRSFLRFWLVCSVGLVQSILLSAAVERAGLAYPVGIALIVLTVPPVNFLLHSLWTYRPAKAPELALRAPPPRPQPRAAAHKPNRRRARRRSGQRHSR